MRRRNSYNDEIREKVRAELILNPNVQAVAEKFGIPRTTVKSWAEDWKKEEGEDSFAVLRQKKAEEFIENAWMDIKLTGNLLHRRLERAHNEEKKIDALLDRLYEISDELTDKEFVAMLRQLNDLKLSDVSKLTTVLGTLYDKQALATKNDKEVIEVNVNKKFEDF